METRKTLKRIFDVYTLGLGTNRDAWFYNYDKKALERNVRTLLDTYNQARVALQNWLKGTGEKPTEKSTTRFLTQHPEYADSKKSKWSPTLSAYAARDIESTSKASSMVGLYRPFTGMHVYYDSLLNHRRGQLPVLFPTPNHHNIGIDVAGLSAPSGWFILATATLPDVQLVGNGQFFPRFWWQEVSPADGGLGLSVGAAATGEESLYGRVVK